MRGIQQTGEMFLRSLQISGIEVSLMRDVQQILKLFRSASEFQKSVASIQPFIYGLVLGKLLRIHFAWNVKAYFLEKYFKIHLLEFLSRMLSIKNMVKINAFQWDLFYKTLNT